MSLFSQSKPESRPTSSNEAGVESSLRQALPADSKDSPRDTRYRSVIQSDLTITGNIDTAGILEFSGKVIGDVRAGTLSVHEGGTIKGNVTGKHVTTDGDISGSIGAGDVALQKHSQTNADIRCDRFAVETGAVIHGKLDVSARNKG